MDSKNDTTLNSGSPDLVRASDETLKIKGPPDDEMLEALQVLTQVDVTSPDGLIESSQQYQLDGPAQVENQTTTKNAWAVKWEEVQQRTHDQAQRTVDLLQGNREEGNLDQQPIPTFEDVYLELETLSKSEDDEFSPTEYILRAELASKAKKRLDIEIQSKIDLLGKQNEQLVVNESNILYRIAELKQVEGIKKIVASREIQRLEQYLIRIREYQVASTNSHRQLNEQQKWLEQIEGNVSYKQKALLRNEISESLQAIKSEYTEFLQEILVEGSMTEDLQRLYIQEVITPQLDEFSANDTSMTIERKDEIYKHLDKCLAHREDSQDSRNGFYKQLIKLLQGDKWTLDPSSSDLVQSIDTLLNGYERELIGMVVKHKKFQTYQLIKEAVDRRLPHAFNNIISNVDDSYWNSEFTLRHWAMPLWHTLKSSELVNEVFGREVREMDTIQYEKVLDGSISYPNKNAINQLYYYPTPAAIRNLVIIAAADQKNDITSQANKTLCNLSSRADWKDLLDQAEIVYPLLSDARTLLESWDHNTEQNHPEIRDMANRFTISVLETEGIDDRLAELAIEALPEHSIVDILVSKGGISKEDAEVIIEADNVLTELSREGLRMRLEDDETIPLVFPDWLRRGVRNTLFEIFQTDSDNSLEQKKENIKRLSELSQMIVVNQEDFNILSYLSNENVVRKILDQSVTAGQVTILLDAYKTIPELKTNNELVLEYCAQFEDEQSTILFRDLSSEYEYEIENIRTVGSLLKDGHISRESALAFPKNARALMDDKMRETRLFILQNGNLLLNDISDIKFMNSLVGEFGMQSDPLIRGYKNALDSGEISSKERALFLEFVRQFRVVSPLLLKEYKAAKSTGVEKVYIARLRDLAGRMTDSRLITDDERKTQHYHDLLQHVYRNNSGQWTDYANNDTCRDRSSDLDEFEIRPKYEIDLLTQSEIRVKDGVVLDPQVKERLQRPIYSVASKMESLSHDKEQITAYLSENIDSALDKIISEGGLQGIDLDKITTIDEKMFLIITDSLFGSRVMDRSVLKDLLITYEFTTYEDILNYIQGTQDRVGLANNQEYALMCELGTFYSDRIKEVNRLLVQKAWKNPSIAAIMPGYFERLAQDNKKTERENLRNRLQIDKLGISESFLLRAKEILEKGRKRNYTLDEVKSIIGRYESWTGGLTEKTSTSPKTRTKAFYGTLRSQRERTFAAQKALFGEEIDPSKISLGEINLAEALDSEEKIREGEYDSEQFASYTGQRFIDIFYEERAEIKAELAKYESTSGRKREVLNGYITKSKESANARMVGGVCVAGDNPGKNPDLNMWDMPNYLQMIFQDPDTLQCQGLVLMHSINDAGRRILTISLNPSSTYLYSIDERALFDGISSAIGVFAGENNFDYVVVSRNSAIRTNRTGGIFEQAMNEKITQMGESITFETLKQFSYNPDYAMQEVDVIWKRNNLVTT